MQTGYVTRDGWRLIRKNQKGDLITWETPIKEYEVCLYSTPPKNEYEAEKSKPLHGHRRQEEDAHKLFDAVLALLA